MVTKRSPRIDLRAFLSLSSHFCGADEPFLTRLHNPLQPLKLC